MKEPILKFSLFTKAELFSLVTGAKGFLQGNVPGSSKVGKT